MDYNMQRMTKTIPRALCDAEIGKGRNQGKHQVLMVDKTTSSSKRATKRKGTSRRMAGKLPLPWRSPKLDLGLKLSASTTKGMVTISRTTPNTWQIRRMSKWTKVYLIYMLLMCTLLVFKVAPGYLILVQLLWLVTWNRSYKMNRDYTRWRCVLEVIPRLIRSPSHTPSTFGISVEPK